MNERQDRQPEEELLDKEVTAWIIKEDRGFTPEEQDAFFQWMSEDPKRKTLFARQKKTWREFDLLAEWLPEHSQKPNPDLLANGLPKKRFFRRPAFAIAASLVAAMLLWTNWQGSEVESVAEPEQIVADDYEYRLLEDGSELDMNRGAIVVVEYKQAVRQIRLLAGEVHFKVAKNPDRPFIVRTRGADVRAVGTAFNVVLSSDKLEVLVTEGQVRMERSTADMPGLERAGEATVGLDLYSGERSVVSLDAPLPSFETQTVENTVIERMLAWKHETLQFENTPLAEAIIQFNRRNDVQIVIADKELEDEPVGGTFRSNKLEDFAIVLDTVFGHMMTVDRSSDSEIVLRKR